MFFKLVCLCSVAACALAKPASTDVVPLEKQQPTVIPIISQSEELEQNGTYKFSYETGNGIKREEVSYDKVVPKAKGRSAGGSEENGSDESDEIHVQQGSYSYTAPDGTVITVRYIADENGFRPIGDHLPKAPAFVQQQIDASAKEKSGRALNADSAAAPSAPVEKAQAAPGAAEPAPKEVESRIKPEAPAAESSPVSKQAPESSTTEAATTAASEESSSTTTASSSESSSTTAASEVSSTTASEESSSTPAQTTTEAASSEAASTSEATTTEAASSTTTAA
ncbi:osteocalcin 2-like [Ostrinia nubilalis]|uniref:osteocalcin 2-like n=1 Tax=Ostrinia nubilalis TaxID=29057 RepID=UPI0030822C08